MHWIVAIALFVALGNAHAQLYRWTDAEGRTHYSNVAPPAGAKALDDRVAPAASSAPPQVQTPARAAAPIAAPTAAPGQAVPAAKPAQATGNQPRVVMYATSWCPYCEQARKFFRARGIEYTEYDIEQSAQARAAHRELGGRGVPLILVGFETLRGFNEQRVLATIEAQRRK